MCTTLPAPRFQRPLLATIAMLLTPTRTREQLKANPYTHPATVEVVLLTPMRTVEQLKRCSATTLFSKAPSSLPTQSSSLPTQILLCPYPNPPFPSVSPYPISHHQSPSVTLSHPQPLLLIHPAPTPIPHSPQSTPTQKSSSVPTPQSQPLSRSQPLRFDPISQSTSLSQPQTLSHLICSLPFVSGCSLSLSWERLVRGGRLNPTP